jgi:hypothetical protein
VISGRLSHDERARIRQLLADIVNSAYDEQYEASAHAARELVALAVELEHKHGPLPALLAIRADHVESTSERESLLHATYRLAKVAEDAGHEAWAALCLASYYVDAVPNATEAERWLSIAEERPGAFSDERVADDLARLRRIVQARRRRELRRT